MKTALVTGATSGIGEATVRALVACGWRCVATGRRKERLDALVDELGADKVHAASFDVRDEAARDTALGNLPAEISEIDPTLGRTEAVDADDTDADDERGGGFRLGFAMALLLAALGLALYVQGPRLADAVPALKQAISSYRDGVNEVRIALDDLARTAVEALEQ